LARYLFDGRDRRVELEVVERVSVHDIYLPAYQPAYTVAARSLLPQWAKL